MSCSTPSSATTRPSLDSGELERRRRERLRAEIEAIVVERAAERARRELEEGTMGAELSGDLRGVDPYAIADRILNAHSGAH